MVRRVVPERIRLYLPEPPNMGNERVGHWAVGHKKHRDFKFYLWGVACSQVLPFPAESLRSITWIVDAAFRFHNLRDENENLPFSLKLVTDALKAVDGVPWRRGVHELKGFLYDDSPRYARRGIIEQTISRRAGNVTRGFAPPYRGVTITLRQLEGD